MPLRIGIPPDDVKNSSNLPYDKGGINPNRKMGKKKSESQEKARQEIETNLAYGIRNRKPLLSLTALSLAREHALHKTFDTSTYIHFLWACAELSRTPDSEHAFWIYKHLRDSKVLSIDVFEKVSLVCAAKGNAYEALEVMDDYKELKYTPTEVFLSNIIIAFSRSKVSFQLIGSYIATNYKLFQTLQKEKGWRGTVHLYTEMAIAYGRWNQSELLLGILKDMMEANFEPSQHLCLSLLESSLLYSDKAVLQVIAGWLLDNFDVRLEFGSLTRLLVVACGHDSPELAQLGLQLMIKNGYKPGLNEYMSVVIACINANNARGAVGAIIAAEAAGFDPLAHSDGLATIHRLTRILSGLTRLDDMYFTLVDLMRGDNAVPKIAVCAIIRASGVVGQCDRAFATFQEVQSLFGMKHCVHTYNSLLFSLSCMKYPSTGNMLRVFQDMDDNAIKPDKESFSVLLSAIAETDEMHAFPTVVNMIKELGVRNVTARSLRRCAVMFALQGNADGTRMVQEAYAEHVDDTFPQFLEKRLEYIHNNQGLELMSGDKREKEKGIEEK